MARETQKALPGLSYEERRSLESKATRSERAEQAEVVKWARALSAVFPQLGLLRGDISGIPLPPHLAAQAKAAGCSKGTPDLCLAVARQGYHHLYIEMKCRKADSRVRPWQQEYMDALSAEGSLCLVCWDAAEAKGAIAGYVGLPQWTVPDEEGRIEVPAELRGRVAL